MPRFVCTKCNYRFGAEKADICPYCGEKTIEREKSAEELVKDVEKILKNDNE